MAILRPPLFARIGLEMLPTARPLASDPSLVVGDRWITRDAPTPQGVQLSTLVVDQLGAKLWLDTDEAISDFVRWIDAVNGNDSNPGTSLALAWKSMAPLFTAQPVAWTGVCRVNFMPGTYRWPFDVATGPAVFTVGAGIGIFAQPMVWTAIGPMVQVEALAATGASTNRWEVLAVNVNDLEGASLVCISGTNAGQVRTVAEAGGGIVRTQIEFDRVPDAIATYQALRPAVTIELPDGTATLPAGTITGLGSRASELDLVGIKLLVSPTPDPFTTKLVLQHVTIASRLCEIQANGCEIEHFQINANVDLSPRAVDILNPLDRTGLFIHSDGPFGGWFTGRDSRIALPIVARNFMFTSLGGTLQLPSFQSNNAQIWSQGAACNVGVFAADNPASPATTRAPSIVRNCELFYQFTNGPVTPPAGEFAFSLIGAMAFGYGCSVALYGIQFDPGSAAFPINAITVYSDSHGEHTAINRPGAALMPGYGVLLVDHATLAYYFNPWDTGVPVGAGPTMLDAGHVMGANGAAQLVMGSNWSNFLNLPTSVPFPMADGTTFAHYIDDPGIGTHLGYADGDALVLGLNTSVNRYFFAF